MKSRIGLSAVLVLFCVVVVSLLLNRQREKPTEIAMAEAQSSAANAAAPKLPAPPTKATTEPTTNSMPTAPSATAAALATLAIPAAPAAPSFAGPVPATVDNTPVSFAEAFPDNLDIDISTDEKRAQSVARLKAAEDANLRLAMQTAKEKNWPLYMDLESGRANLTGIKRDGSPVYSGEYNVMAAITANVYPLRKSTYAPAGLQGEGWTVGVWEPGRSINHPEFTDRSTEYEIITAEYSDHATHVIGTIISDGHLKPNSKGMAPKAKVNAYTAGNDVSEMTSAAANNGTLGDKIFISNHSYGQYIGWDYGKAYKGDNTNGEPVWLGDPTADAGRDNAAGLYEDSARKWDALVYSAGYYLPFRAAGNDRGGKLKSGATFYWRQKSGGGWEQITDLANAPGEDGGRSGGYESISAGANAKNIMVIGNSEDAVKANWTGTIESFFASLGRPVVGFLEDLSGATVNDNENDHLIGALLRDVASAKPNSSSCWGPTDDGRIKPDLMANGTSLYSTSSDTNTPGKVYSTYAVKTGTSMASPSAAGAAVLLQEYHNKLFGKAMRSSALKALMIHTADELESFGPDYRTGWGLVNAERAADQLKNAAANPDRKQLYDSFLSDADPANPGAYPQRESESLSFEWDGVSFLLKATLVWNDPPGEATTREDRSSRLRNDLDIRIITPSGQVMYPFVLDPENPSAAAKLGDNVRDNVEQIYALPQAGRYRLVVSRKGTLFRYDSSVKRYGKQPFSLVISGNSAVTQFPEGLDQASLDWNSGGEVGWDLATGGSPDNVDFAQCKTTAQQQSGFVETSIEGGQRVSWWWNIEGPTNERSAVYFVMVDGIERMRLNAPTAWRPAFIDLPPGTHKVRWTFAAGQLVAGERFSGGLDMVKIGTPTPPGPYLAQRAKIPGKFEFEDFDTGGAAVSYFDSDFVNTGGAYRTSDGVDIQAITDGSAGFAVYNGQAGEWMNYAVNIEATGLYSLEIRYASDRASSIKVGLREFLLPATGSATTWQTLTVNGFEFLSGPSTMRVEWTGGAASLNWLNWIRKPYPTRRAYASATNPNAQPINIVGARIQGEDFDTGGESIAYHDADVSNLGGKYRTDEDVDIRSTDDPLDSGGFQVTRFAAGEYLRYSILVPEFDDYEVHIRMRPASSDNFSFVTGKMMINLGGGTPFPYAGVTNTWLTLTGRVSQLPRGLTDLKISVEQGIVEFNYIEFVRVPPKGISKIIYLNRPGVTVDDFYPAPRGKGNFPRGFATFSHPLIEIPTQSGQLRTYLETPTDIAENYGVILAGYIVPPATANYTFYVNSDDQSEFWLSTDEQLANSLLVAWEPEWSSSRQWISIDRRPVENGRRANVSPPIPLEANKRYYVEAIMKEGTGGDNLGVAWWRPGLPAIVNGAEPISAEFLRPLEKTPLYEVRYIWPDPAPITYGTPLTTRELNMTLTEYQEAGTVTYDPPLGTVLPAGRQVLTAVFTPKVENSAQLQTTTNHAILFVDRAPLTVAVDDTQREAGQPNPNFTVTFFGLKNDDNIGHFQPPIAFQTDATPSSPVGTYTVTPYFGTNPNYTINYQAGTLTVTQGAKRAYSNLVDGTPLPGRIEAENFDHGGEGLGFVDSDPGNNGGQYRPNEGVDLETTTDTGGGFDVAWTAAGEWQEYTVNVPASGFYNLTLRVAQVGVESAVRVWMGDVPVTGTVLLPDTGGYQNWVDVSKWSIPLNAGKQVMRIEWLQGGANLNWIEWRSASDIDGPKNIVWWKFDEGFADFAQQRELLPVGFNGSVAMPELRDDSPTGQADDRSVEFDGLAFVNLPEVDETTPVNFEARDYTVEAWVKFTRPADGKSILATWGRPGAGGWSVWIDSNGNLGATSYGIVDMFTTATLPDDGQWHHVAFIHQLRSRMLFYIDGQLKETQAMDAGVAPTPDHTLHVGYEMVDGSPLNPFIGKMDRLRVTDFALQVTQFDYPAVPSDRDTHGLNRLIYRYVPGDILNDFYPEPRGRAQFPNGPEPAGPGPLQSGIVDNFEAPSEIGDYYGEILFGYLVPKVTGDYTFYIAGDNESELWLSTSEDPLKSIMIAMEPIANPVRQWDSDYQRPIVEGRPVNVSRPIPLKAGHYYYVEASMKEHNFDDHLGVTWQLAGQPVPENGSPAITGEFLRTTYRKAAAVVDPPVILVTKFPAGITLVWRDTLDFVLQRTDALGSGTWTDVPFTVANGEASASVPTTGTRGYFRVRRP